MKSLRRSTSARIAALAAAAFVLAGCSSEGGGDWVFMLRAARDAWESRDAPVPLNQAAAIPYATLGVRIGDGREQIVILATDVDGKRLWTSSSRVALTTRYGRIMQTAGFGNDLSGYSVADTRREDWTKPHIFEWTADFKDLGVYSAPVSCQVAPAGPDPISILGKQFDTIRVDETCRSEKLDWTSRNSYWVSPESGRVWRSRQQVNPKGLELEIELLRPPISDS